VLVAAGLPYKTDITEYELYSPKIKSPVTAVLLSDLHNDAGTNRRNMLVKKIREINPDLILMPGDMAEERNHQDNTVAMLYDLKGIPMYFSTGNHEEYRWDLTDLMRRFIDCGVTVLRNESEVVSVNGNDLEIAGISCRYKMEQFTPEGVNELFHTDNYRILLSHKPNWMDLYEDIHADLFLCGHAHGGQWHIPGTEIGIAAPSQGLLPKYISGVHAVGEGEMVIGRGLVRHYHGIPRLYNNPEIVVLHLNPVQN
jgi:predicted MPP superfamily phosphohydrolase